MENTSKSNSFWSFLMCLTSCIPRKSENISKEFWVPDGSTRVCYECGTKFTIFTRRHHCRECGQIFCRACTKNSIPAWSSCLNHTSITDIRSLGSHENSEMLRACNYCFNQWKNKMERKSDNEDEMNCDRPQSSYSSHYGSNSYDPFSDISNASHSRDETRFTDELSSTLDSDTTSSFNNYSPTSALYKIKTSRNILDVRSNSSMWAPPGLENPEEDELSGETMSLTFGRSLNLSFSYDNADKRVDECGHYIQQDCIRFNGNGSIDASMHYEPITINNVLLPPFNVEFGDRQFHGIEKEANELVDRAWRLFEEILANLYKISDERAQIEELEGILRKEKSEFEDALDKGLRKENEQLDILEINKLRRQLIFFAHLWDRRLVLLAKSITGDSPEKHSNLSSNPQNNSELLKGKNKKNMLFTSISLDEETVSQERSFLSRRTKSDGHYPIQSNDPYDLLDAKWTGRNDPFDIIDNASSSFEDWTGRNINVGIAKPDDSLDWTMSPFLHFYRSLNKKIGMFSCYDPFRAYTPVYINSPEYLGGHIGPRFYAPIGIDEIVIPLFDNQLTSIIAYALTSYDYHNQLSNNDNECSSSVDISTKNILSPQPQRKNFAEASRAHLVVNFVDDGLLGKMSYSVTCYYAKYFSMLRKKCCISEIDFVRSLSRCKKWNAEGGKSNVFFAKTQDERFIVKQVTKVELQSFLQFGHTYFKYLSDSIGSTSPTCLAKIFGIYQVTSNNIKRGKDHKIDILVMENLLFGHNITRLYDLKGSMRSRYNPDKSGKNKVFLDENLIEEMPTSPIFVWKKAKSLLERAVWNDTSFLSSINVMDYSLLVGIDEGKDEITIGIIDFLRQYTLDKRLETWVKASGILGGPNNVAPTVISPEKYKVRFRIAMSTYFLVSSNDGTPDTKEPKHKESKIKTSLGH